MDRFLIIQWNKQFGNGSEFSEKVPSPPNGYKWCIRKIGLGWAGFAASGYCIVRLWNAPPGETPIGSVSTRKLIQTLSCSYDDTNKVLFHSSDKDYPRGSKLLYTPDVTITSVATGTSMYLHVEMLLELISASQIDQLKNQLLNSD